MADRDEQLADAARAIAAGSRAGGSIEHALDHAATESPEPLATDVRGVVSAISLGVPVGEALESWAAASGSDDVRLLVGALELHRRSGGDLPFMLDGIAATLRDRRAAAREVRALTAQARLSGAIVGFLPLGFFGFLWMTSPNDMGTALRTSIGLVSVGLGLLMEGVAFLWIRHLLEVR
jgi:tight adherence protein B